jgi:protease-4
MSNSYDAGENTALSMVLNEFVKEQRRKRRWGMFGKILILAIVIGLALNFCRSNSGGMSGETPHTALIELDGVISAHSPANADNFAGAIRQAFKAKGTKGIVIRINSPGGSPVQSDYMFNEIMRLRKLHPKIPVYAVCTDICASGAYFVAAAANDIYANPASLVGSIGVIMNGFGFDQAIKKVGVTRRVFTAGKYKDFMDPFAPMQPYERKFANKMLATVHKQFIAAVEEGRGKRLNTTNKDIFSGLAWTGETAKKLGLVDAYGSTGYVARDVIKEKKIINYTIKPNPFDRLADRLGATFANVVFTKLEQPGFNQRG